MTRQGTSRFGDTAVARVVVVAALAATVGCSDFTVKQAKAAGAPVARIKASRERIAGEADVFRTRPGDLELDTTRFRRPAAHPRTLATYRAIRAFPGAPPVIPHGLTATEFRTEGCRTCHERGGYSVRFGAYVPVTPHPELSDCLSCHLPDYEVVGIAPPPPGAEGDCGQCHAEGGFKPTVAPPGWQALAWPTVAPPVEGELPPPIPHDLTLRTNCNACHMGPGAVKEIRTHHADRANCRQCHLRETTDDSVFTRPGAAP